MAALIPFFSFFVSSDPPGMTVSDNSENLIYDGLISVNWSQEHRAYLRTTDEQVPHATEANSIVFGVVDSRVDNERNQHKSRRITTAVTLAVNMVDKHLGTAWGELQRFADEWTVTKSRSSTSAVTPIALLVGASDTANENPANWHKDDITVASWGTRDRQEYDPELGILFKFTESVVAHGTALPTNTTTAFYEQRQVDAARDILTTVVPGGGSGTAYDQTLQQTIQYTYPALLASWNGSEASVPVVPNWTAGAGWLSNGFEEANERSIFQVHIQTREAFTQGVQAKVRRELITAASANTIRDSVENTTAFGTGGDLGTATTKARIFNPRPRDISYNGLMFSMQVANVLCDGATLTATANSDDTYYGPSLVESFTFPNSNITATAYIALIGSTVCIEDSITPWKFGMFLRTRTMITVK